MQRRWVPHSLTPEKSQLLYPQLMFPPNFALHARVNSSRKSAGSAVEMNVTAGNCREQTVFAGARELARARKPRHR